MDLPDDLPEDIKTILKMVRDTLQVLGPFWDRAVQYAQVHVQHLPESERKLVMMGFVRGYWSGAIDYHRATNPEDLQPKRTLH